MRFLLSFGLRFTGGLCDPSPSFLEICFWSSFCGWGLGFVWLGYEPYGYMWPFLRDEGHFVANLQARQTGKTFNGMAKLLWIGFRYPGSEILVTAPKFDQAKNVAFKALGEHLERMRGLEIT